MPMLEFVLPPGLCRIDGKKANRLVGVNPGVRCNLIIRDPESGQGGLSAEDDGPIAFLSLRVILLPENVQVKAGAGNSSCLLDKIVREVLGRAKEMRVNIDQHFVTSRSGKVLSICVLSAVFARAGVCLQDPMPFKYIPKIGAAHQFGT